MNTSSNMSAVSRPGVRVVARAMIAIDQNTPVGQIMPRIMAEREIDQPPADMAHEAVMRDPPQRDEDAGIGQLGLLRGQKFPTLVDLGRRRLVLRRKAFHRVDDDYTVEPESVVRARSIFAPGQSHFGESFEQQVPGIIAGERPARPIRPMLAGSKTDERQPCVRITPGGNGRVPPVGMFGAQFFAQRDEAGTKRAVMRRLGCGERHFDMGVIGHGRLPIGRASAMPALVGAAQAEGGN